MTKVVFNRETLTVSGVDRDKLSYEVEILNVNVENLTKQEPYTQKVEETDIEGKPLYLLPVETPPQFTDQTIIVETTEVTDKPILFKEPNQVPLLNDKGEQVKYRTPTKVETTGITNEPVMVEVYDEETQEYDLVQKENEEGQPLYYKTVYSPYTYCFTTEEVEVQKTDSEGNLLYYKEETIQVPVEVEDTYEKIYEDDPRWEEYLPRSLTDKEFTRVVTFADNPEKFTYTDILNAKEKQLKGTMYTTSNLFEQMDETIFSTDLASFNANLGFDFVNIPSGGQVRTVKLPLEKPLGVVAVHVESSDSGLNVQIGAISTDLQTIDKFNERYFSTPVEAIYVLFTNTSDKPIDLHSFAILG